MAWTSRYRRANRSRRPLSKGYSSSNRYLGRVSSVEQLEERRVLATVAGVMDGEIAGGSETSANLVVIPGVEFTRVNPLGTLGYVSGLDEVVDGTLTGPGDFVDFPVYLSGDDTIGAVVVPHDSITISVEVLGESAAFSNPAPGDMAVMPPQLIGTGGLYTIRVSGDGAADFELILGANLAIEDRVGDSFDGNELAIDDSHIGGPDGGRYAVYGYSEVPFITEFAALVAPEVDEFTIDFTGLAGQQLDIVLGGEVSGFFAASTLELLAPDETTVLATATTDPLGSGGVTNYDLGILGYEVPADGVYTLRFSSSEDGPYTISVFHDALFEAEPNGDPLVDPLRDLTDAQLAVGYLGLAADTNDFYTLGLQAGEVVTISTDFPLDHPDIVPVHTLDPELEIFGPGGELLYLSADNSASWDDKNEVLAFVAHTAGVYTVRVGATSGDGEYMLQAEIAEPSALSQEFIRVPLFGGLGYYTEFDEGVDGSLSGPGDFVDFPLFIEEGQTLAAMSQPLSPVSLSIELLGVPGTYTNFAPGELAVMPPQWLEFDGTYTLRISSDGPTDFFVEAFRNFAVEEFVGDSFDSNELAIDDSNIARSDDFVRRYGVVGYADGELPPPSFSALVVGADVDEYTIDLAGLAGLPLDIVLGEVNSGDFSTTTLELLAPDETTVLATATADPLGPGSGTNYLQAILGFEIPADGVYTLRLTSNASASYSIIAAVSIAADTEPNNDPETDPLREVSLHPVAAGFLDAEEDANDFVTLELVAGQSANVETFLPFRHTEVAPVSTLDTELEIFLPNGDSFLLADSGTGGLEVDESVNFVAPATGTYFIRVGATSGRGEYILNVTPGEVAAEPVDPVVTATALGGAGQVALAWVPDPTHPITLVVRSMETYPNEVADGETVYEGTATSFIDSGEETLADGTYYYSFFATNGTGSFALPTDAGAEGTVVDASGLAPSLSSESERWISSLSFTDPDQDGTIRASEAGGMLEVELAGSATGSENDKLAAALDSAISGIFSFETLVTTPELMNQSWNLQISLSDGGATSVDFAFRNRYLLARANGGAWQTAASLLEASTEYELAAVFDTSADEVSIYWNEGKTLTLSTNLEQVSQVSLQNLGRADADLQYVLDEIQFNTGTPEFVVPPVTSSGITAADLNDNIVAESSVRSFSSVTFVDADEDGTLQGSIDDSALALDLLGSAATGEKDAIVAELDSPISEQFTFETEFTTPAVVNEEWNLQIELKDGAGHEIKLAYRFRYLFLRNDADTRWKVVQSLLNPSTTYKLSVVVTPGVGLAAFYIDDVLTARSAEPTSLTGLSQIRFTNLGNAAADLQYGIDNLRVVPGNVFALPFLVSSLDARSVLADAAILALADGESQTDSSQPPLASAASGQALPAPGELIRDLIAPFDQPASLANSTGSQENEEAGDLADFALLADELFASKLGE